MQSLDVFLPRILSRASGCSDPMARQALVDSAIDFCEQTLLVQYTGDPQASVALQGTYDLDLPTQQVSAAILNAWWGTTPLDPAASSQIDAILAYVPAVGGATQDNGTPSVYYEYAPGVIGIYPVPRETLPAMVTARIATKPARDATQLEDVLYTDWVEAIVGGALHRLCSTPGQTYTDSATASLGLAAFNAGVGKASGVQFRGRISGSVSVKPRKFA